MKLKSTKQRRSTTFKIINLTAFATIAMQLSYGVGLYIRSSSTMKKMIVREMVSASDTVLRPKLFVFLSDVIDVRFVTWTWIITTGLVRPIQRFSAGVWQSALCHRQCAFGQSVADGLAPGFCHLSGGWTVEMLKFERVYTNRCQIEQTSCVKVSDCRVSGVPIVTKDTTNVPKSHEIYPRRAKVKSFEKLW